MALKLFLNDLILNLIGNRGGTMTFTVIGSRSAYPLAGEATSCYLIQEEGVNIVVDLGAGSLSKLQAYIDIEELDALIITHYHPDHFSDIYCLQHAVLIKTQLGIMAKKLTIYGPDDPIYYPQLAYKDYIQSKKLDGSSVIHIKDITIAFMETQHCIYGLAVKLIKDKEMIVYTSDSEVTQSLIDFSHGCDLLVCECSLYKPKKGITGHMAIIDVKKLILESSPKRVLITHLPPYGDNQDILDGMLDLGHPAIDLAHPDVVVSTQMVMRR